MSFDRNILSVLMDRGRFRALRSAVEPEMLDQHTASMLQWFDVYFKQYPEHEQLDPDTLLTTMQLRTGAGADKMAALRHLCDLLKRPVSKEVQDNVVNMLEEKRLSGEAGSLLSRYESGEELDIVYELGMLAQRARSRMANSSEAVWMPSSDQEAADMLASMADEGGLQWDMFPLLQQSLRGAQPGDNIALSAPTDQGKTSLLMLIADSWAAQAVTLYPDRPLLYLINEGTSKKLTPRFYQTVLHATLPELAALAAEKKLIEKYCKRVGRFNAVIFLDIHGKNVGQVARLIEQHKPYAVITDMTGRIKSNANKTGGANDIAQLEDVWNSMRELAAMYEFVHMGTVQVSAEGFDMLYPPLSAMQNSKTGIQTTLDLCLMMGALQDVNLRHLRGLSTPKNKMARTGKASLTQFEVTFKPERNIWT